MLITKAFKYRAYPNKAQEQAMLSVLETHRRLYNNALAQRRDVYQAEKRSVSYPEQNKQLTADRKTNALLGGVSNSASQRTLRRLDKAFQASFAA